MKNINALLIASLLVFSAQNLHADPVSTFFDLVKGSAETAKKGVKSIKESAENVKDTVTKNFKELIFTSNEKKQFQWTKANLEFLASGNAIRGEAALKKLKCVRCHGKTGISDEDDTPSLAGQIAAYTFKQMHDYKSGLRDDSSMLKSVRKLNNRQMIDIATFFAAQKPQEKTEPKVIPALAKTGDKKRLLIGCEDCHNPYANKRGFQTPFIKGQKPEYFSDVMMMFKEEERANDHYAVMRKIAKKLTEEEIEQLTAFYATPPEED